MYYKILILTILINLSKIQTTNSIRTLSIIGGYNSTCDRYLMCSNPTLICINNKCLCRNGFKL